MMTLTVSLIMDFEHGPIKRATGLPRLVGGLSRDAGIRTAWSGFPHAFMLT